jgi:hypothetical protein
MRSTSIKDLLWDRRFSEAVIGFLHSTDIGRRYRERRQEEDALDSSLIFRLEAAMTRVDSGHHDDFSSIDIL